MKFFTCGKSLVTQCFISDLSFVHACASNSDGAERERPPPYVPPPPPEDEEELFRQHVTGINFDKYDEIEVNLTGRNPPRHVEAFEQTGLHESLLANVKKARFTKPTPVQKYAIPVICDGRDLMACAQTGSGKTVSHWLVELGSTS